MIKGVILDLDGTVYRGDEAVPGAPEFVRCLRRRGVRVLFVTNRANRTPETVCGQLCGYAIDCTPSDVLTSAQATARFLGSGSAYCVGEPALETALRDEGLKVTHDRPEYVVVGYDRSFSYEKMRAACTFIVRGARFIATNPDRRLCTPDGVVPGTGAIVASIAVGSGREPTVVGKPQPHIMHMALDALGLPAGQVLAVGDNLETDVPSGRAAGMRTALILTGVSTRADLPGAAHAPDWVIDNYDELDARLRAEERETRP